jgi:hypothetical protein
MRLSFRREPDRQVPAPAQTRVIGRPVHDLAPLLGDVVATLSVGLERHDGNLASEHGLPAIPAATEHQLLSTATPPLAGSTQPHTAVVN